MLKRKWETIRENRHLILSIIFGIFTSILFYTGFGTGDHIEQLPIVIRSINYNFLLADFFTNASSNAVPRYWFSRFLAVLAGAEKNLPVVYFILVIISNISISVITFNFAKSLFKSSRAGVYAAAISMSVPTFSLGWLSKVYQTSLIPTTLAVPLIFGGIYSLMRGKFVVSMLLCGLSSVFHPLLGLECGGLLLGTHLIFHVIKQKKLESSAYFGVLIFLPFIVLSVFPQISQQSINSADFINIVAFFRHPHHYVPSTFELSEYISAGAFLIVLFVFYYRWVNSSNFSLRLIPGIIMCLILILCMGGYVFVELIPSRIWVTAQTFRLLYLIKWFGIVFLAGEIIKVQGTAKLLLISSVLDPIALVFAVLSQVIRSWQGILENRWIYILFSPELSILVVIVLLLMRSSNSFLSIICLSGYILLFQIFKVASKRIYFALAGVAIISAGIFVLLPSSSPLITKFDLINRIKHNISFEIHSDLGVEGTQVAEYARENLPENSIFLTPPNFGQFRILARRAILVDYKAFPFSDEGLKHWYERLTASYGVPRSAGFHMIGELDANYKIIDDQTITHLMENYDISYAVLYIDTPTDFDVLYQNNKYKIICLKID